MDKININDLDRNFIYVSDGTWFDKDSICFLEHNLKTGDGIFRGNVSDNDKLLDGELCQFNEFDVYTPEGHKIEVVY